MVFRFGIFEFDDQSGELRRNGRTVALEPQPARALARLLSRSGDLVSREELRDAVWGANTHVDFDRGLAYCLSQVRAALGDSADNPRFVQTLPKRGYKFLAPVSDSSGSSGSPGSPGWTGANLVLYRRWRVAAMGTVLLLIGRSRKINFASSCSAFSKRR